MQEYRGNSTDFFQLDFHKNGRVFIRSKERGDSRATLRLV